AGLLALLGESSETAFARLARASWRLYPDVVRELQERTGIDVEYVTRGTIYPMSASQTRRDAEVWAVNKELGVEVVDGQEVQALEPALSPKINHAIFVKGDHWLNNQRLVLAYAQAAVAAGVELHTACNVSRVVVEGGRARAVVAEGERVEGDAVLLAAGAWTSELVRSLGMRLPVEPRRGQMIALTHAPPVLTHCVHGEAYLVPRPSGELLIGATVERAGFQRAVTAEGIAGLLRAAIELAPSLRDLPIARTWCGFRPWAPDGLPILGPWPGIEGLWVSTAHFRNGILLAPITAVDDRVDHGRESGHGREGLSARSVRCRLRPRVDEGAMTWLTWLYEKGQNCRAEEQPVPLPRARSGRRIRARVGPRPSHRPACPAHADRFHDRRGTGTSQAPRAPRAHSPRHRGPSGVARAAQARPAPRQRAPRFAQRARDWLVRFWDTSALVPLFVAESQSRAAAGFLRDDPGVVVWSLRPVQLLSAF